MNSMLYLAHTSAENGAQSAETPHAHPETGWIVIGLTVIGAIVLYTAAHVLSQFAKPPKEK